MSRLFYLKLALVLAIATMLLVPPVADASLFSSWGFPSVTDPFTFGSNPDQTHAPGTTVTKVENLTSPFSDMFSTSEPFTGVADSPFMGWNPFAPAYSSTQSTTRTVMGPGGPETIKTDVSYDPATKQRTTTTTYL